MQNIQEFIQNCKGYLEEGIDNWGLILVIFLAALGSFGLGRLSALEDARPPVAIETPPREAKPAGMYIGGLFVASKTGGSYYYPWCISDTKILPANQVWFKDESSAQKAGYKPAKNCKGLTLSQ